MTAPTPRIVWTSVSGASGVAADRDRHLADPEHVEHRELARRERIAPFGRLEFKRERVLEFVAHLSRTTNGTGAIGSSNDGCQREVP